MCFSAATSFTVTAALIPIGAYCVHQGLRGAPRSLMFAVMPLVFAGQQALEGFVWLDLERQMEQSGWPVYGYLFFSHFFWLWWVPLAAWYLQPRGARKTICGIIGLLGMIYGATLFLPLLLDIGIMAESSVGIAVTGRSLSYQVTLIYAGLLSRDWVLGLYALCVISPLLLQSDLHVRMFGAVVLASMLVAAQEFTQSYISVWCFFAAVASAYLLFMLPRHGRLGAISANAG